jgi:hypothetical protein
MMTDEQLSFALRIDHNRNLAVGKRVVDAVIEIRAQEARAAAAAGPAGDGSLPPAAEVIIIDTSRSMTGSRIRAARQAAMAAVDALRDGTYFAVVAGHTSASMIYPAAPAMVPAGEDSRARARTAIAQAAANGQTSMSSWLRLADELLTGCPAPIRHAVMLTDGHSTDPAGALPAALAACAGHFVCDCRGVGDAWRPDELREIGRTLLGGWAPVAAPENLADDFRAALAASMAKRVPGVMLRIRPTGQTRVTYLAQVMPVIEDLTGRGTPEGFPLGDWGAEARDYHLRLEASQDDLRIENGILARAAVVEVLVPAPGQRSGGARPAASASLGIRWTTDIALSSVINQRVAGYTGQEDLAAAVDEALDTWKRGRPGAEALMGRAVALAYQARNEDLLERLSAIARILDPAAGAITLRRYEDVSQADVIWATYLSEQSQHIEIEPASGG